MRAGLRISRVTEDAARVALITIALLAVLAAPAQAWQPSDNAYMHKYEEAAIGLWGSAPDCLTVEYIWLEADPWGEHGVRGRAADCRMWLMDWDRLKGDRWARREGFAWNCFLVLHEWGHLLGYDHDVIQPRHAEIERYCAREADRQYHPHGDFALTRLAVRVLVHRHWRRDFEDRREVLDLTGFAVRGCSSRGCRVTWTRHHGHTHVTGTDRCRVRQERVVCVSATTTRSGRAGLAYAGRAAGRAEPSTLLSSPSSPSRR
jgi:hypothetical protein